MGYPILEVKSAKPKDDQNDLKYQIEVETERPEKPRWLSCVAFTISALTVIITAMSVGMVIGYSYCYFEHRTNLLQNNTRVGAYEIVDASDMMTEPPFNANRTINGAIKQAVMSSILVSKIYNIMHQLAEDTVPFEPEDPVIRMTNLWDMFPEEKNVNNIAL